MTLRANIYIRLHLLCINFGKKEMTFHASSISSAHCINYMSLAFIFHGMIAFAQIQCLINAVYHWQNICLELIVSLSIL